MHDQDAAEWQEQAKRAEAKIAAVLAVCDRADAHDTGHGHWVSTGQIRAAIEAGVS